MVLLGTISAIAALIFVPIEWRAVVLVGICTIATLAICIELPILDRIRVRNTSYEFNDEFVRIRRGAIFVRDVVLPADKIVSIAVSQGPLQRVFALASVRFISVVHVEPLGPMSFDQAVAIREVLQRDESHAR